jgi:hypothetical protein
MGYTRGGLGKSGKGIVVPITPKMKSPRKYLGYGVVVSSLRTPGLVAPREVLLLEVEFILVFQKRYLLLIVLNKLMNWFFLTCKQLKILLLI